jgi:TetR/AcrR family transcriptional regulator, lmrAB and yxaGH operons repressor
VYLCFPGGKSELICEATRTAGQVYTPLTRSVTAAADPGPDSELNLASCLAAFVALWQEVVVSSDFKPSGWCGAGGIEPPASRPLVRLGAA